MAEGSGSVRRQVVRLAWPMIAESILGTLTQMVDMVLVAPLGAVAVAAVGLSTQPLWFLMGPFLGLGAGAGALVARFVGGGEPGQARAAARQAFVLGLGLAAAMGALIGWQAPQIITLMGGQPDVVPSAAIYLRSLAPGLAALFLSMVMGAVSRAAGDTRTPFYISAGVNVINLVLAWALIYGHFGLPALGLAGAGVAASISRALGALVLLGVMLHPAREVRLDVRRLWHFDLAMLTRILKVGVPAAGERIATSLAYVVYSRIVSSLGTVIVAAHYTAVVAEQISWMIGTGLTTAAATLVGQSLGAGAPAKAARAVREALRLGLLATVPLVILFGLFPEHYLGLFSRDPEVIRQAAWALRVGAVGQAPMILSLVYIGALTGSGDTRVVAGISLVGGWVVRLSLTLLLVTTFGWGLGAAWAASVLDWSVRVGLLWLRFRSGRWQEVRV